MSVCIPLVAQPIVNLTPQRPLSVCPEEILSFSCKTDGSFISFSSPPIINALNLFSTAGVQTCMVFTNSAAGCIIFDDSDSTTFEGSLMMFIPSHLDSTLYNVTCEARDDQANSSMSSTTFEVIRLGKYHVS